MKLEATNTELGDTVFPLRLILITNYENVTKITATPKAFKTRLKSELIFESFYSGHR